MCCTSDDLQHLQSFMRNSSCSSSTASPTDYQYKGFFTRQTIKCFFRLHVTIKIDVLIRAVDSNKLLHLQN